MDEVREDDVKGLEDADVKRDSSDSGICYEDAAKYWDGVAPTVEGMLGGFGKISPIGEECFSISRWF